MNFGLNIKSVVYFADSALSLRLGMRLSRKEKGEDGVVLRNTFPSTSFSPAIGGPLIEKRAWLLASFHL
jgi:hypothetical protein